MDASRLTPLKSKVELMIGKSYKESQRMLSLIYFDKLANKRRSKFKTATR